MMRVEAIPQGCRVYAGDMLVAVVTSNHHYRGKHSQHKLSAEEVELHKAGAVVWEPMDPASTRIHFCSPEMGLEDVKAVLAALAKA